MAINTIRPTLRNPPNRTYSPPAMAAPAVAQPIVLSTSGSSYRLGNRSPHLRSGDGSSHTCEEAKQEHSVEPVRGTAQSRTGRKCGKSGNQHFFAVHSLGQRSGDHGCNSITERVSGHQPTGRVGPDSEFHTQGWKQRRHDKDVDTDGEHNGGEQVFHLQWREPLSWCKRVMHAFYFNSSIIFE